MPTIRKSPGHCVRAYRVNTVALLEVLSMVDRKLDAARLQARCHVDGLEHLEAARNGRGAILLATHSGNSLLLAAQLAERGWPITVVYRRSPMMSLQFFADGLPRYGMQGILANEGFRAYAAMVDALRHDRVLFAMMDQGVVDDETGMTLRFLGKDMPMPGGVVQLARQVRSPILPVEPLAAEPVWHFAIRQRLGAAAWWQHRRRYGADPAAPGSADPCSIQSCGAGTSGAGGSFRWQRPPAGADSSLSRLSSSLPSSCRVIWCQDDREPRKRAARKR